MPGVHPLAGFADGRGFSPPHQAVDIPAPAGTPVRAMGAGVVSGAGDDTLTPYNLDLSEYGGGKLVAIRHALTSPGRPTLEVVTQYAHLSAIAAGLQPGDRVSAGQVIGLVGRTGTATGNHLHLGVRIGGVWRHYKELLAMPGTLTASGVSSPGLPPGYGSGPVQPPPNGLDGQPVSAYPLDEGKTCAPGYRPGMVNPRIGALPGMLWWNRPNVDGLVLACVRDDLDVGDNAAAVDAERITGDAINNLADTIGDVARNFGLFLLFAVILVLGLWALARGAR